ncbi:MAG: PduL/EutD family phosphate acyltransferase [Christensenellales bacterium]|jgi:putative phosphotransacetylase|nr:phosphate propanoyltransferase [Clostridiales bacterium]
MKFLVETSARHLHVSKEHLETLFGEGFELSVRKDLSQPGQFASGEKVQVVGPRGQLNMSILGPCRKETQVEVSFTDARALGVTPPVRESGDTKGSVGCKLVGPKGEVELEEGVIVAKRHIHATPEDAEKLGVQNGDVVSVKVDTGKGRAVVLGDTVVRVSPSYAFAMHIDTDECNAAAAFGEVYGEIVR